MTSDVHQRIDEVWQALNDRTGELHGRVDQVWGRVNQISEEVVARLNAESALQAELRKSLYEHMARNARHRLLLGLCAVVALGVICTGAVLAVVLR